MSASVWKKVLIGIKTVEYLFYIQHVENEFRWKLTLQP